MNAHWMPLDPADLSAELDRKVARAADSMNKRYAETVPEAQRDLLLAFYILGLTTPLFENESPASQLNAVHTHLLAVMSFDRADAAINASPPTHDEWLSGALKAIESFGHRDGHALFMQCDDFRRIHHTNDDKERAPR